VETLNAFITGTGVLSLALYGVATFFFRCRLSRVGHLFFGAGWVSSALLVFVNVLLTMSIPLGNMHALLLFLSFCFFPLYVWISLRSGVKGLAPLFSGMAMLPLVGSFFTDRSLLWSPPPILQSPWFLPHVAMYMMAYSLAAIAFFLEIQHGLSVYKNRPKKRAETRRACEEIHRALFPFLTIGILSGCLWADQAWGFFWTWDPKETGALITWILYALLLHVQGRRHIHNGWVPLLHTLAFLALLGTFLMAHLFPRLDLGLHGYL